jgi:hypothetical protein
MNVSVVIPAWNAADTIADALASLLAQSFPDWEAIIIDDGSDDRTLVIAEQFARQDRRVRVVSQPQMGAGEARNRGISHARFDWLLFLDADDWLLPEHLELLTNELAANPWLDAAYCNWARVTPDGTFVPNSKPLKSGKMFAEFACHCSFVIHSCIVRRSLVGAVGKFSGTLRICQDWDLWQRITRTGAIFGTVPQVLACYRLRTDSLSMNGRDLLNEGLRVISQGHAPDARVRYPDPAYAYGKSKTYLTMAKFSLASWAAGLEIGGGRDARPLLNAFKEEHEPTTSPQQVAECIFEAAPLPTCRTPGAWSELWSRLEPDIDQFLAALEEQTMAPALALRARTALEQLIVERSEIARPVSNDHINALTLPKLAAKIAP